MEDLGSSKEAPAAVASGDKQAWHKPTLVSLHRIMTTSAGSISWPMATEILPTWPSPYAPASA